MTIRVTERRKSGAVSIDGLGTISGSVLGDWSTVSTDVACYEVPNISRFAYVSDVLSLGDPWSAVVPDPQGRYRDKLRPGAFVELYLANPNVSGGQNTRKVTGRITRRRLDVSEAGSVVNLEGADLGVHLRSNVPIWKSLRGRSWKFLAENCLDPSWGFTEVRLGNDLNQRLNNGRAEKVIQLRPTLALDPFARIETTPGQTVADLLITYARRKSLMVNVSSDGYLQTFAPDYSTKPLYKLRYFDWSDPRSVENNVERLSLDEDEGPLYTDVLCVAESVYTPKDFATAQASGGNAAAVAGQGGQTHQGDVHAGKFPRAYVDRTLLPYVKRKTFSDGEMYSPADAYTRAFHAFNRGRFDAWTLRATVRGHWNQQDWWEAGLMCDVEIDTPQLSYKGNLYVKRVECTRTDQGDLAQLELKLPDLLYEVGTR